MEFTGLSAIDGYRTSSKTLQAKIRANQRYHNYRRILRKIRLRIFDYEDESSEKLAKAQRIIDRIKKLSEPFERLRQSRIVDRRNNPQLYK